jgi:hypothetical protein
MRPAHGARTLKSVNVAVHADDVLCDATVSPPRQLLLSDVSCVPMSFQSTLVGGAVVVA